MLTKILVGTFFPNQDYKVLLLLPYGFVANKKNPDSL